MSLIKWIFSIQFLITHIAFITCDQSPQISTALFNGVPDNWATNIKTDPFVKIGKKYYYIPLNVRLNWFDAQNVCRKMNANLPSIETPEEFIELDKHFKSLNINQFVYFWTSGNDLIKDRVWYWYGTGKPISYYRWAPNEPNGRNEHCVQLKNINGEYRMNDVGCHDPNTNVICEARTPNTIAFTVW